MYVYNCACSSLYPMHASGFSTLLYFEISFFAFNLPTVLVGFAVVFGPKNVLKKKDKLFCTSKIILTLEEYSNMRHWAD